MKDKSNKKFWERIAKIYTIFQEKGNKELYEELCQKIKPQINDNQEVLELACGTGQLTVFLANSSGHWLATDFSKKMVIEAKRRFNTNKVSYDVQDTTKLSYEDHTFDVISNELMYGKPLPECILYCSNR